MTSRPVIAIPGRFSESASALRYRALVTARALSEGVFSAGGEPVTIHPWAPGGEVSPDDIAERLSFADGILLPGGGDLAPSSYGHADAHDAVYDVDDEQDAFDLAVAQWALEHEIPLLSICRGTQVVNVVLGGDLVQHMSDPHRHVTHQVSVADDSRLAHVVGASVTASCYHHQCLDRLGSGVTPVGRAEDGTVEAIELPGRSAWYLGVQWHPEDTAAYDDVQASLFRAFVEAARANVT